MGNSSKVLEPIALGVVKIQNSLDNLMIPVGNPGIANSWISPSIDLDGQLVSIKRSILVSNLFFFLSKTCRIVMNFDSHTLEYLITSDHLLNVHKGDPSQRRTIYYYQFECSTHKWKDSFRFGPNL